MDDSERAEMGVAAIREIRRLCRVNGEPDALLRRIEQVTGFALERIGDAETAARVTEEAADDDEEPQEEAPPVTLTAAARARKLCRNRRAPGN